jgi:hypothetical protein
MRLEAELVNAEKSAVLEHKHNRRAVRVAPDEVLHPMAIDKLQAGFSIFTSENCYSLFVGHSEPKLILLLPRVLSRSCEDPEEFQEAPNKGA